MSAACNIKIFALGFTKLLFQREVGVRGVCRLLQNLVVLHSWQVLVAKHRTILRHSLNEVSTRTFELVIAVHIEVVLDVVVWSAGLVRDFEAFAVHLDRLHSQVS